MSPKRFFVHDNVIKAVPGTVFGEFCGVVWIFRVVYREADVIEVVYRKLT
jgi:hypothetical protein